MSENQDGYEWSEQALTKRLRAALERHKQSTLSEWKAASEKSTDPRVAAAFSRYLETYEMIQLIHKISGERLEDE